MPVPRHRRRPSSSSRLPRRRRSRSRRRRSRSRSRRRRRRRRRSSSSSRSRRRRSSPTPPWPRRKRTPRSRWSPYGSRRWSLLLLRRRSGSHEQRGRAPRISARAGSRRARAARAGAARADARRRRFEQFCFRRTGCVAQRPALLRRDEGRISSIRPCDRTSARVACLHGVPSRIGARRDSSRFRTREEWQICNRCLLSGVKYVSI
jgi:hypothetical protein